MKFAIQPVECRSDVLNFAITVIVFACAQSGPAKIEPQYRVAEAVQRLHGVKDNFVMQRSAIDRMRMAHKSGVSRGFRALIQQGFQPSGWAVEEKRTDGTGLCVHGCVVRTA